MVNQDTGEFCFIFDFWDEQEEEKRGLQPLNEKCVVIFGYLAVWVFCSS